MNTVSSRMTGLQHPICTGWLPSVACSIPGLCPVILEESQRWPGPLHRVSGRKNSARALSAYETSHVNAGGPHEDLCALCVFVDLTGRGGLSRPYSADVR